MSATPLAGIDPASLSPEALAELDALMALEAANPLAVLMAGGSSPKQLAYLLDPSKNRMLQAGNKTGKTYIWVADQLLCCLGQHPARSDVPFPCKILCVVADFKGGYAEDVCEIFHELMPPDVLSPRCNYSDEEGYRIGQKPVIRFKNGSRIIFRAGTQAQKAVAGIKADMVAINEPPERRVWGETTRAAAFDEAPISMVFTPVDEMRKDGTLKSVGDLRWLRCIVAGDPDTGDEPTGDWSIHRIKLTVEDCPQRTQASIDAQIGNVEVWEYEQRVNGDWESVSGDRSLRAWKPTLVIPRDVDVGSGWPDPREPVRLALVVDHGEKAGASFWGLFAFQPRREGRELRIAIRLIGEHANEAGDSDDEEALYVKEMVERTGLQLGDVDFAWGDHNTGGKSRGGRKLNDIYSEHFTRLMNVAHWQDGITVRNVWKGTGSIDLGLKRLNQSMAREDYTVSEACPLAIRANARWAGDHDELSHRIDVERYAVLMIEREVM